jgi:hypothetical protein
MSTIRRADIDGLVDQVREAAAVGELADPALGPMVEKWLGYVERVVPLFERVAETMAQLRGVELAGDRGAPGAPEGMDVLRSGKSDNGGNPRRGRRSIPVADSPQPGAPGAPEVYAALVEALGYCPADMTTGDALKLVENHKGEVMERIKAKLGD